MNLKLHLKSFGFPRMIYSECLFELVFALALGPCMTHNDIIVATVPLRTLLCALRQCSDPLSLSRWQWSCDSRKHPDRVMLSHRTTPHLPLMLPSLKPFLECPAKEGCGGDDCVGVWALYREVPLLFSWTFLNETLREWASEREKEMGEARSRCLSRKS